GMVCVVGRIRDLILQLSKSSIYSTKPSRVINHSPVTLSAQQIEESRTRLSALKIYPRDMLINRTFKAKLEELWARALGDEREEIGRVITDFDAALQSNDMARVDEVRRRASVYLAIETS
ncbi:hypothetical protein ACRXCY_14485, partial [Escherichia coli]